MMPNLTHPLRLAQSAMGTLYRVLRKRQPLGTQSYLLALPLFYNLLSKLNPIGLILKLIKGKTK